MLEIDYRRYSNNESFCSTANDHFVLSYRLLLDFIAIYRYTKNANI